MDRLQVLFCFRFFMEKEKRKTRWRHLDSCFFGVSKMLRKPYGNKIEKWIQKWTSKSVILYEGGRYNRSQQWDGKVAVEWRKDFRNYIFSVIAPQKLSSCPGRCVNAYGCFRQLQVNLERRKRDRPGLGCQGSPNLSPLNTLHISSDWNKSCKEVVSMCLVSASFRKVQWHFLV